MHVGAEDDSETPQISLDDLLQGAALQTRVDRKYLVPASLMPLVTSSAIELGFSLLTIDGLSKFTYDSTYFDTPDLRSYQTSATGRRHRFKVRTRIYVDSGQCMLEVKTRGRRGVTVKTRIEHENPAVIQPHDDLVESLIPADVSASELEPSVRICYQRQTLGDLASGVRVTLDSSLSAAAIGHGRTETWPLWGIVETKSARAPSSVDRWLWAQGIRPGRISKFGIGMATTVPGLAANRWNRALNALDTSTG